MSESILLKKCDIPVGISNIIQCDTFSSYSKLIRVTRYVIKFVQVLLSRIKEKKEIKPTSNVLTAQERSKAEQVWLTDVQRLLKQDPKFIQLKVQLVLFTDEYGVIRSKGRLSNADLHYTAKYPALLPHEHYFTKLVVKSCHERVNHCGVKDTLAELRTQFWVVRGRQFVKSTL